MAEDKEYQVKEVPDPEMSRSKMIRELILYKMDRNLAILGIVVIAGVAIATKSTSNPVAVTAISSLGMYAGIKGAK